jgi:hypothetical protein
MDTKSLLRVAGQKLRKAPFAADRFDHTGHPDARLDGLETLKLVMESPSNPHHFEFRYSYFKEDLELGSQGLYREVFGCF